MRRPALIFDFGNVVAHFDYQRAASTLGQRVGLSGQEVLQRLRDLGFSDLLKSYEAGQIPARAFSRGVAERIGLTIDHDDFARAWADIFTANESIAPLLAGLKRSGYTLVLGSNTNDLHAGHFRRQFAETLGHFDRLVLSYEVGHIKPSAAFYLACAEETPAAISAYVQALHDAGVPPGVVNLVFGVPDLVSRHLIAAPIIRKVSFTGSTTIGRQIAALSAPGLKRVTLELGGHAPTIIFDDADIDHAVGMLAAFKFFNAGQVCFAPTRFLVQDGVHDRFVKAMAEAADAVAVGPGLDDATRMGPLANPRRLASLAALVGEAVADGAIVAAGGEPIDRPGNWWRPTVLAEVSPQSRIMREEPFGPVALTARFSTMEEAIERANSLPYGLSAFVFTQSATRAMAMTDALECGLVGVNTCLVASPDAPFGGVKDSGYGYDYASEGLDGYLHSKYVHHHGV